jgi:hypothetical protein
MADQGAVIIRDAAGTEHEFPAGFDPKRAAAIVKAQSAPPDAPRDGRGRPLVTSDTSDGPPAGIAGWFEQKLRPLLEQVAHPQTISDIAALLIPDAGVTGAVRAGAKGLAATGRGVEAVAQSPLTQKAAEVVGGAAAAGESFRGAPLAGAAIGGGIAVAPKVVAAGGRVLQRTGAALERAAADAPAAVPVVASDQRALNEAALAARREAYQASQAPAAPTEFQAAQAARQAAAPAGPIVAASGKMQLTAPEMTEFTRLLKRGLPLDQALAAVKDARELAARLGGASPGEVAKAVAHRGTTGAW